MKYKYIVWDWNGTLLDDLDVCLKSINTILEKYKLPKLKSVKEYREKFGFPVINYYKAIGFDFSKYTFKTVGKEFIDIYTELSPKCNLHNDALETLILDTTHDAEVAKSLNCDCILFSQGHQDYDRLFETKNKVFKDLNNIYRYITSLI